jgi:hypothetical protein
VEKKGEGSGGIFAGKAECREVASAVTDANGECRFDAERLKNGDKYRYFCAVKESLGVRQSYPCGGKTSDFLEKGKPQKLKLYDSGEGSIQIQYNNLLNPSQPGDN